VDWHLTLNIPTYTKCAKIYQNLMLIVKGLSGGDQHSSTNNVTPKGGGPSSRATPGQSKSGKGDARIGTERSYVDQLV
jgi:hypothetical protein